MPATAASHTIVRPGLHCFGPAPASRWKDEVGKMKDEKDEHSASSFILPTSSSRTANLLVIDKDVALMPEWIRQAFPAPAHRVQVAATGAEGLRQVRINPPDVILLDPRLPDQSGLDVYE